MKEDEKKTSFEQAANETEDTNFLKEFYEFLSHNKKWWLLPIIIVLLMVGLLVTLGGSAAAPFIYSLF
jgi:hypothetical protein